MLVIMCPGQGSQTPGMLTPWLEMDGFADLVREWSDATGVDLVAHGTVSDEETIKDTAVAQPLIVAAGLLSARALGVHELGNSTWMTAGHSVGEVTATALSGVLSPAAALDFVRVRAMGMAQAAAAAPSGMSAVVGGKPDEVFSHLESMNLTPANVNGGGQIVAAGADADLQVLNDSPPAKARVIPLKVAGAFHTTYMQSAVSNLDTLAQSLVPQSPSVQLLSNRDGASMADGPDVIRRLVDQLTHPVRWDLCMASLQQAGVTGIVELLPGGTLVGLAKRAMKGVPSVAVKSPDDLDKAREFIAEHAR